jgi:Tfp pilus assembly protein PilV
MLIGSPRLPRVAREESGFTLIETLVAIVTGVIVTGALFAILEVSLHQSARVVDVVQASQLSRTTMTHIVDELHSACIAPKFQPIETGSNANELTFINGYSKSSQIPLSETSASEGQLGAYKHTIKYEKSALIDYTYPSTAGTWPEYTFSATASPKGGVRIGENISQTESPEGSKTLVPIFQYYKYAGESSSTAETPLGSISTTRLVSPLSATDANETAAVQISFRTASADNNSALNRSVDLSSQVTLAFSAPNSEATIGAGPCE